MFFLRIARQAQIKTWFSQLSCDLKNIFKILAQAFQRKWKFYIQDYGFNFSQQIF